MMRRIECQFGGSAAASLLLLGTTSVSYTQEKAQRQEQDRPGRQQDANNNGMTGRRRAPQRSQHNSRKDRPSATQRATTTISHVSTGQHNGDASRTGKYNNIPTRLAQQHGPCSARASPATAWTASFNSNNERVWHQHQRLEVQQHPSVVGNSSRTGLRATSPATARPQVQQQPQRAWQQQAAGSALPQHSHRSWQQQHSRSATNSKRDWPSATGPSQQQRSCNKHRFTTTV